MILRTSPCSSADEPDVVEPREVLLAEDIVALTTELFAIHKAGGDGPAWECPGCVGIRLARLAEAGERGIGCAG